MSILPEGAVRNIAAISLVLLMTAAAGAAEPKPYALL
jgi:hypothetical protein